MNRPVVGSRSAPSAATAQDTAASHGTHTPPRDLDALHAAGRPFPQALRAAIRARGLGLERIQAKLAAAGTPVSLATLSHWQSGRSQPERDGSLAALARLETILGLAPHRLRALLDPPRRRGRRNEPDTVDLFEVYRDQAAVTTALRTFDTLWGNQVIGLSQHDRALVDADGLIRSVWNRRILRATVDGPDRVLVVYHADEESTQKITCLRGCTLGRVVTDHRAGLIVAELLFSHPLRQGEFLIMEHRLDLGSPFASDTRWIRRLPTLLRQYVVEVEFARTRRPARCLQITSPAADSEDFTERAVALDEHGRCCAVALDIGRCQFGIRWEWTAPPQPRRAQPRRDPSATSGVALRT